jgi:hypothetical protein
MAKWIAKYKVLGEPHEDVIHWRSISSLVFLAVLARGTAKWAGRCDNKLAVLLFPGIGVIDDNM